ncbi:MAG TPA: hypothetical protein VNH53_08165 [Sphingomicrobium sp.]|nr:hypothetical protein [Sphingomicrobium sp.]
MSGQIRTYRVYCYDAAEKTVHAEEIEARSDAEAIAAVEKLGFGTKCELWDGKRLVATLEAERRQA